MQSPPPRVAGASGNAPGTQATHLGVVEAEAGAVLAHLCLAARLPSQHLLGEHPELVLDGRHLRGWGDKLAG